MILAAALLMSACAKETKTEENSADIVKPIFYSTGGESAISVEEAMNAIPYELSSEEIDFLKPISDIYIMSASEFRLGDIEPEEPLTKDIYVYEFEKDGYAKSIKWISVLENEAMAEKVYDYYTADKIKVSLDQNHVRGSFDNLPRKVYFFTDVLKSVIDTSYCVVNDNGMLAGSAFDEARALIDQKPSMVQIVKPDGDLSSDEQKNAGEVIFTDWGDDSFSVKIDMPGILDLVKNEECICIQVDFFESLDQYEDDWGIPDFEFSITKTGEPDKMKYFGWMYYNDGTNKIPIMNVKPHGQPFYDYRAFVTEDEARVKFTHAEGYEHFSEQKYYKVYLNYKDTPGTDTRGNNIAIASGEVKERTFPRKDLVKEKLPQEYSMPSDKDFFVPMSEYYRVYEREYPETYVATMEWLVDSSDLAPCPNAVVYGPGDIKKTSAKVTYLESVDEFGQLVQYLVRIAYEEEDDVLTAFIGEHAGFYPYIATGKNEASLEGFPTDFFAENTLDILKYYDLDTAFEYYEGGALYLDMLPLLVDANSLYDEYNDKSCDPYDLWGYERTEIPIPHVANLATDYGSQTLKGSTLVELDRKGTREEEFKYDLLIYDVKRGDPNGMIKDLSGTFRGYSTLNEIMQQLR